MNESLIKNINKYGKKSIGMAELLNYLNGLDLTPLQSIKAKCFDCNGYYADGRFDCKIKHCPLHPYMPYNKGKKIRKGKPMSEERKKEAGVRLRMARLSLVKAGGTAPAIKNKKA